MSDGCCKLSHGGDVPVCPTNGQVTRPVPRVTVEALIADEHRAELTPQPYFFCDAPACDTVYVSALGDHLITKDQLVVRVGIKETEDPIPLCYCFGYDRSHSRGDVRGRGGTGMGWIPVGSTWSRALSYPWARRLSRRKRDGTWTKSGSRRTSRR